MRALFVLLAIAVLAAAPAAAAQQKSSTPKSPAAKSAPSAGAPLNINTATLAQLETLPGLGRAVAERIVEYRDKNGNFKKVEEIIEFHRLCPCLLTFLRSEVLCKVAFSR